MANFSPLGGEFFNSRVPSPKAATDDCKTQSIPVTLGRDSTYAKFLALPMQRL